MPPRKATSALPLPYRITLLLLEPLFALNGALLTLFSPTYYLTTITRNHPSAAYHPSHQFLYTQLAGGWLLFAFNSAVVLRLVDDLRVWKLLCWGMLVSDVVWHVSAVQAVGGWERFVRVGEWGFMDWAAVASGVGPMVVRGLVVMGVGERREEEEEGRVKGE